MKRAIPESLAVVPHRRDFAGRRPRVSLLLNSAMPDYASLVRGCVEAAEQTGRIEVFYRGSWSGDISNEITAGGGRVAGILCRATAPEHMAYLRRCHRPVVFVEQDHVAGFPSVRADNAAIGRMAAEFLLAKGHRRFGFLGVEGSLYSDEREQAFAEIIHRSGNELISCHLPLGNANRVQTQMPMERWLSSLPRPVAVLADMTTHAREIVALCESFGFAVPEEVAVLSCDNDDLLCATIHPSISGIDQNMWRVGYEATMVMIRLLAGETVPRKPLYILPSGVVERQSTDSFAISDRRLATALNRIRTTAATGKISMEEVARTAGLSRRALQLRFRTVLGRTVQQEIVRVRIDAARRLLLSSHLSMSEVAEHCGYESGPVFTRAFYRETGVTPSAFRRKVIR